MAIARIIRFISAVLLIVAIIGGAISISNANQQYEENKKYIEYATVNGGYRVDVSSWDSMYRSYPAYAEGRGNKAVEAQNQKKNTIVGMVVLSIFSLLGFGLSIPREIAQHDRSN